MKGFCPSCEKESELIRNKRIENLNIKGEMIPVEVDVFTCTECGEEFDNPAPDYDPLAIAYQEYRKRKGMVQPREIIAFREKYKVTQRELSELVGFGGATLSRYENGALQDDTHDMILHLIMEPQNFLEAVIKKPNAISNEKRISLIEQLRLEIDKPGLLSYLKNRPEYRNRNLFNGLSEIDINRLLNIVKIFCFRTNVYKTRLNKLLFYADFKCFKEYGKSITGLCYAHLPLGPVPDQYEIILDKLTELDSYLTKEEDMSYDCPAEFLHCEIEPDVSVFSLPEMQVIFQVKDFFGSYNARQIKDFSHEEEGYKQTTNGELISYAFAEKLKI